MPRPMTFLFLVFVSQPAAAATLRVPGDHLTIQSAIDAARPGDTVLVASGRYVERIALRPGIVVRSVGDDARGELGLRRAEATVLDGGGANGDEPGVAMAEGSTLDRFTITRVGVFDESVWEAHRASRGEELGDDEGAVRAEGTVPAIAVHGVECNVVNNVVHHNGDVGIAVTGDEGRRVVAVVSRNVCHRNLGGGIGVADHAEPIVRGNLCRENLRSGIGCRNASPMILENRCLDNVRAGIGCRESASPIVRDNVCRGNRRAGIGIRMEGTAPIVEGNECHGNAMAGIGSRDGAEPVVRGNECHRNAMAGIGSDGSRPLIVGNDCRENEMAGIGVQGGGSATIHDNECRENHLVAIGVTEGSDASITANRLGRTGGGPPIVAVKDGSTASLRGNRIDGGGVAAVLVEGRAIVADNEFVGRGEKQGTAVWVWRGSTATIASNSFDGYRAAVDARGSAMVVTGNEVRAFRGAAIVVRDGSEPAHVFGNTAISKDENAVVAEIVGATGVVTGNVVRADQGDDSR